MLSEIELETRQLSIEEEATNLTNKKEIKKILNSIEQGRFTDLPHGGFLMKIMFYPVLEKLNEYYEVKLKGNQEKRRRMLDLLASKEETTYIVLSTILNMLMKSNNNSVSVINISKDVGKKLIEVGNLNFIKKNNPKLHKYLGTEYNRASPRRRDQIMKKHIQSAVDGSLFESDYLQVSQTQIGADLLNLVLLSNTQVIKQVKREVKHSKFKFINVVKLEYWVLEELAQVKTYPNVMMKPMIVKPRDWVSNVDGGYLKHQIDLVKDKTRYIEEDINSADYSKVLPIINKLQQTSWRINRRIYDIVSFVYNNNMIDPKTPKEMPRLFGDIPTSTKSDPIDIVGEGPGWIDNPTAQQKKEWGVWNRMREEVTINFDAEFSRRLQFMLTLGMAKEMVDYDKFWYVYNLDYRGRVYPHTDFLTPQSKGFTKAMLEFGEGRHLTERGEYWLKIHIANTYGLDKESFEDRIVWFEENVKNILGVYENELETISFWAYADSAYEFLAGCLAYYEHTKGNEVYLPIQLDAVNSGVQFYSGLLYDREGAEATCVVGDKRSDLYKLVSDSVNKKLLDGDYPQYKEFTDSEGETRRISTLVEAESLMPKFDIIEVDDNYKLKEDEEWYSEDN